MYAFATNDYTYYRETGLILFYLSYFDAETVLDKKTLIYKKSQPRLCCIIILHHVINLTTYQNLRILALTAKIKGKDRHMLHIQHYSRDDIQKNLQ